MVEEVESMLALTSGSLASPGGWLGPDLTRLIVRAVPQRAKEILGRVGDISGAPDQSRSIVVVLHRLRQCWNRCDWVVDDGRLERRGRHRAVVRSVV